MFGGQTLTDKARELDHVPAEQRLPGGFKSMHRSEVVEPAVLRGLVGKLEHTKLVVAYEA